MGSESCENIFRKLFWVHSKSKSKSGKGACELIITLWKLSADDCHCKAIKVLPTGSVRVHNPRYARIGLGIVFVIRRVEHELLENLIFSLLSA